MDHDVDVSVPGEGSTDWKLEARRYIELTQQLRGAVRVALMALEDGQHQDVALLLRHVLRETEHLPGAR